MPNTKLTRQRWKDHMYYGKWIYIVLAIVAVFVTDLLYSTTEYRPPDERKVTVQFVSSSASMAETVEQTTEQILSAVLPMDETLALCAVDLGGRPYFVYDASFAGQSCGGMDVQMAREFFYAVSYSAMMNLHLKVLYGENDHHKLEAMYKAFAKALSAAARHDDRIVGVLSTKGSI